MMPPGSQNFGLEESLEKLPDQVADRLHKWRILTLKRERIEARLFLGFKGQDGKRTAEEIKSLVRSDGERYQACLDEIVAEVEYNRFYEKLMSAKKIASLRTAI